ncbi:hypothetical protein EK21DRAFT_93035 [Setomelanomma holmii]|uniref:LITAF domain-containing protein n=1 Tax=Setomelanomma holmii TaxID=210430 RepID=A0A9P4H237_9PLEO|nr:hypothetical protein EK21DRAFT_93035 [Setomelanomma holmii]
MALPTSAVTSASSSPGDDWPNGYRRARTPDHNHGSPHVQHHASPMVAFTPHVQHGTQQRDSAPVDTTTQRHQQQTPTEDRAAAFSRCDMGSYNTQAHAPDLNLTDQHFPQSHNPVMAHPTLPAAPQNYDATMGSNSPEFVATSLPAYQSNAPEISPRTVHSIPHVYHRQKYVPPASASLSAVAPYYGPGVRPLPYVGNNGYNHPWQPAARAFSVADSSWTPRYGWLATIAHWLAGVIGVCIALGFFASIPLLVVLAQKPELGRWNPVGVTCAPCKEVVRHNVDLAEMVGCRFMDYVPVSTGGRAER